MGKEIREQIESEYEVDGFADSKFDDALLGVVEEFGGLMSPVYNKSAISDEDMKDFSHYYIDGRKTVDDIHETGEDYLLPDGYDEELVGIVERHGIESATLYDREKVLEKMASETVVTEGEDPMTDALDHYYYNFIGGYLGPRTWKCVILYNEYE